MNKIDCINCHTTHAVIREQNICFQSINLFSIDNFFWFLLNILQRKLHTAGSEDDTDIVDMVEGLTMIDGIRPVPGGPFSTLTPSMWPQEILAKLGQPEVVKFITTYYKSEICICLLF